MILCRCRTPTNVLCPRGRVAREPGERGKAICESRRIVEQLRRRNAW